jgi:hypothetical protein
MMTFLLASLAKRGEGGLIFGLCPKIKPLPRFHGERSEQKSRFEKHFYSFRDFVQ